MTRLTDAVGQTDTIIQSLVPEDKRARVMSYYTMAFIGMAPFGSLLAGSLANRIGSPITVLISGLLCMAGAVWFASQLKNLRALLRPIYIDLGIISDAASGVEDAVAPPTLPNS